MFSNAQVIGNGKLQRQLKVSTGSGPGVPVSDRLRVDRKRLRGSADRSWFAFWSPVPSVPCPCFADEPVGDDDRVREGDECVDHAGAACGADV